MPAACRLPLTILLCGALAAGCAGQEPAASGPSAARDDCPQVQVVGLRGQSQSLDHHRGLGTELDGIVTALERHLARDGTQRVSVEAVRHRSRDAAGLALYDADVAQGRRLLTETLQREIRRCPDAQVVVVGFSQGAQIAQETLGEQPRLARHVDAVALVGNPRHDPRSQFIHLHLPGPTATLPGSLGAGPDLGRLDARTVDVCLTGDVVCNADGSADYTVHKHGYEPPTVARQVACALVRTLQRGA